jgi:hypothetical protein
MVLISRGFEYGFNAAIAEKGFNQMFPSLPAAQLHLGFLIWVRFIYNNTSP